MVEEPPFAIMGAGRFTPAHSGLMRARAAIQRAIDPGSDGIGGGAGQLPLMRQH